MKKPSGGSDGSTTGYSYDAAGNLSQAATENGSSDYTFDGANRLTSVIGRNAAGEAQSKTEFVYDGLSRLRVSKDFTRQKVGWVAVAEKRRVYDGMNVVQERDGTNERLAFYTRGLDMGGGIGGLLARSGDGVNLFYHYDGRGSVGQLTNAGGELAARYTYDAFGVLIGSSGAAASINAYRFSTKEAIGSLVYYGFRFYSPGMGKWINRDPIEESGGINLYKFAKNSPFLYADSYGKTPFNVSLAIAGAAFNFFTELGTQILTNVSAGRPWYCFDYIALGTAFLFGAAAGLTAGNPILMGALANTLQTLTTKILQVNGDYSQLLNWDFAKQLGVAAAAGAAGGGIVAGAGKFNRWAQGLDIKPIHGPSLYGGGHPIGMFNEEDMFMTGLVVGTSLLPASGVVAVAGAEASGAGIDTGGNYECP